MKIVIEGDLQISSSTGEYNSESIHYKARKAYVEWFLNDSGLNREDYGYISLGDLTESSLPTPNDTQFLVYYFTRMKNKKKYILAGNHDFSRDKNSYSFSPLLELEGVEAFFQPTELQIDNCSFKILPYYYDYIYSNLKSMREEYESYSGNYDFILFHFEDETQDFGGGKGINLSKLKGRRIGGHIHTGGQNYITSPLPNKSSEVLPERYLYLLDTETKEVEKIIIPHFLDYKVAKYPEKVIRGESEAPFINWEIRDYVNKEEALKYYREQWGEDFFVHKMVKQTLVESSEHQRSEKVRSIKELWQEYKLEKKVDENVNKIVSSLI